MFESKFIQSHARTIVKESKVKTIHVLWGWKKNDK